MSQTSVRLLRAASEIVGGDKALAECLGISEKLLRKFIEDTRELPDLLVLHAVDIILADRGGRIPTDQASAAGFHKASLGDH
jgi:hypothetical protein